MATAGSVGHREVLSQAEVESELERLMARLEEQTEEHTRLAQDQAQAEVAWKRVWALCYLGEKGPVEERKQRAQVRCGIEYEAYRLTSAELEAVKQAIYTTRTQLDVLRTISANVRAQT